MSIAFKVTADKQPTTLYIRNVSVGTRRFLKQYMAEKQHSSISAAVNDLLHQAHINQLLQA